jgi:hypothetical protein
MAVGVGGDGVGPGPEEPPHALSPMAMSTDTAQDADRYAVVARFV